VKGKATVKGQHDGLRRLAAAANLLRPPGEIRLDTFQSKRLPAEPVVCSHLATAITSLTPPSVPDPLPASQSTKLSSNASQPPH
jgi:hypothetical protein